MVVGDLQLGDGPRRLRLRLTGVSIPNILATFRWCSGLNVGCVWKSSRWIELNLFFFWWGGVCWKSRESLNTFFEKHVFFFGGGRCLSVVPFFFCFGLAFRHLVSAKISKV